LKVNFLHAVRKATLSAEVRVVKAGSAVGYVECDVKDETGRLVARAASTCMKRNLERNSGHFDRSAQGGTAELGRDRL
jgi:acyl-coenzyme A thioesterase PaaI-like protein